MGIFSWSRKEKKTDSHQNSNLIDGIKLMNEGSQECVDKFVLYLQEVGDDLVLREIELLDNTLDSDASPALNKAFWDRIAQKYKDDSRVIGMLKACWAMTVNDNDAKALARWLELYLKLDWLTGREWCASEESDRVISAYVRANPNDTDRRCTLIFGVNNCEVISSSIFAMLMYVTDVPKTPLADKVLSLIGNTLCRNASPDESGQIRESLEQLLKSVRKEISADYVEFVRSAVDIYNKNNPTDTLWRP